MKTVFDQHTIAAIATPIGEGALAVIRISGPDAITVSDNIFRGKIKLTKAASFSIHYGRIVDYRGEVVDEVLASVFREPLSYSGENTVEISCHGGYYVTQKVFDTILRAGVRQAEPGEFTKRAFLNGRIDLSQAEAVGSLIAARSESYYRASMNQLEGRFSREIKVLRSELLNLSSLLEIDLDFSEEGISLISKDEIVQRIRNLKKNLNGMIGTYENGKRYREGVSVAIVGKPNAGKSSLFNALLAENRAIVSETAGTTRDFLEESIVINGVLFRLTDTAGLRDSIDSIEAQGVSRTKAIIQQSDVILCVIDLIDLEEFDFSNFGAEKSVKIVVLNKSDLVVSLENETKPRLTSGAILVSAKNRSGLDELRTKLYSAIFVNQTEIKSEQIISARHYDLLTTSTKLLDKAENSICCGIPNEFVSTDVSAAAACLDEIAGNITSEDTLNNIFANFCIGK